MTRRLAQLTLSMLALALAPITLAAPALARTSPDTTATAVSCGSGQAVIGAAVTCTVTVHDTSNSASTPTGSVTLTSSGPGTWSVNPCHMSQGTCTSAFTAGGAANDTITASYPGTGGFAASSGTTTMTVSLRATSTAVSCAVSTMDAGTSTTCSVSVADTSPGAASTPTGSVMFSDLNTSDSSTREATFTPITCQLDAERSCSTSYSPTQPGDHTITASYQGDAAHGPSSADFAIRANDTTKNIPLPPLCQFQRC